MRRSATYARLGTTEYAYVVVVDTTTSPASRVTGDVLGDFGIKFFDPSGSDISGSTSITVSEYGTTGAYRFAVPLPSSGPGNYTLQVTDSTGEVTSCVFMAYATLQGDTGDESAQLELWILDVSNNPVSGVVIGDLTVRIYNPSMTDVAGTVSPTLTELDPGHYTLGFDASSATGEWYIDVLHAAYFPLGKQGFWRYLLTTSEVADAPALTAAVNDGTGTSATLSYTAADAADTIYTYYREYPGGAWVLSGDTRVGSGDVTITGLSNLTRYEFVGVASQSGSAVINQSAPSVTMQVYVSDGTTLFADVRDALYTWVAGQTTLTTIWMPTNAPMPAVPFVTMRMRPVYDIAPDAHQAPDSSGIATIVGQREFMLEVEVYGDIQPAGADAAQTYCETIKRSLYEVGVVDTLSEAGIAFREALPTQDLTDVGRTDFESRYMFEARFGLAMEHTEDVGYIASAENPTGTYG